MDSNVRFRLGYIISDVVFLCFFIHMFRTLLFYFEFALYHIYLMKTVSAVIHMVHETVMTVIHIVTKSFYKA